MQIHIDLTGFIDLLQLVAGDWFVTRPPGLNVDIIMSGVQLVFRPSVLALAVQFFESVQSLTSPAALSSASGAATSGSQSTPDSEKAARVRRFEEVVMEAFAQHGLPVYHPVKMPVVNITATCPGLETLGAVWVVPSCLAKHGCWWYIDEFTMNCITTERRGCVQGLWCGYPTLTMTL